MNSNFQRSIIGGIAFIGLKGIMKIYYKQQQFLRQAHRQIKNFENGNSSLGNRISNSTQTRASSSNVNINSRLSNRQLFTRDDQSSEEEILNLSIRNNPSQSNDRQSTSTTLASLASNDHNTNTNTNSYESNQSYSSSPSEATSTYC